MTQILSASDRFPIRAADQCVQCGLCLPHCPTYRKTGDENESPRGRIALMRAMVRNQLPLTPRLESHLDRCLGCRNCEAACPAQVPYGRLVDDARAFTAARRRSSPARRLVWRWAVAGLLTHPGRLAYLGHLLRGYQRSGLQAVMRRSRLLRWLGLAALEAQLPAIPRLKRYAASYPVNHGNRGEVALFLGCIARVVDQPSIDAAIRVLNKLGYSVSIPPGQNCCGAIQQHAGDAVGAKELVKQNLAAFASLSDVPVITLASGCGAMLKEYGQHTKDVRASELGSRVYDLSAFLEDHHAGLVTHLTPKMHGVAVHQPCSLRNVMKSADKTLRLISRVCRSKVAALPDNGTCCGAAGIYFLTQPEMSAQLRDDTLQAISDAACHTVVTSNIGCALHLMAGIHGEHLDVEVIHPAVLIDRVLNSEG